MSADAQRLLLYDRSRGHWSELARISAGYPSWSRDGTFLHFRDLGQHRICRLRIRDARLEPVASLKGVRQLSTLFGGWVGLAPDDIPLAVNGLEHQEIYALEWEAP